MAALWDEETEQDRREDPFCRVLDVLRRDLIDMLSRGQLKAYRFAKGTSPSADRQPINPQLWRVLKPDFDHCTAAGAGHELFNIVGQAAADAWVEAFCDLVRRWRPIGWADETGQIRSGIGPFLERRMRERQAYVARHSFPTRGDKSVRAQSIRGRMALEGLHIPRHAPWRIAFEAELLSFPAGKHDDQVDALGLVGQLLDRMVRGTMPTKKQPPQPDGYQRLFADQDDGNWETV